MVCFPVHLLVSPSQVYKRKVFPVQKQHFQCIWEHSCTCMITTGGTQNACSSFTAPSWASEAHRLPRGIPHHWAVASLSRSHFQLGNLPQQKHTFITWKPPHTWQSIKSKWMWSAAVNHSCWLCHLSQGCGTADTDGKRMTMPWVHSATCPCDLEEMLPRSFSCHTPAEVLCDPVLGAYTVVLQKNVNLIRVLCKDYLVAN